MGGLRTVTVLEHEVIPVFEGSQVPDVSADVAPWLSEPEAQALLRLNDLRRGFCQRLSGGIKLAQHCGIVRLPTCVVEVLPKVGMADARTTDELERSRGALLAMLHSARQVRHHESGNAPQQAVHAPLLDIFIEAFLHCALDQARKGLISRYVAHADDLPVIKGRFQAHGHVRRNLARPHLLHCEYDEFTADNAYNRAVRATLDACRTWVINGHTTAPVVRDPCPVRQHFIREDVGEGCGVPAARPHDAPLRPPADLVRVDIGHGQPGDERRSIRRRQGCCST
jgi:5-methylcytosine-specific restriction enzyme subunit McrC